MITDHDLRKQIWSASFEAGSQQDYARSIGVHPAVLSSFMSGKRQPSRNLLNALGYERVVGYKKKRVDGAKGSGGL